MRYILMAEDSEEDFEAFQRIFNRKLGVPVIRCRDGEDFLTYLTKLSDRFTEWPSLILLDLNMPGIQGLEVLTRLKNDPELRSIPTVVFSSSSNPKDVCSCYAQGANGYMIKPINYTDLERTLRGLVEYWKTVMVLPHP